MQWAFLGNPTNRRCQFFVEAVQHSGAAPPIICSYESILKGQVHLAEVFAQADLLRLESPGEDATVFQQLLQWGVNHPDLGRAPRCSVEQTAHIATQHGRLAYQRQHYLGYQRLLHTVEQQLQSLPQLRLVNSLDFVRCCFNKAVCQDRLAVAGVPVPPRLGTVAGYEDLQAQLDQKGWSAAFIKPWHGSSAAGVLAYRRQGDREQVTTSVEVVRTAEGIALYNSLQLCTYRDRATIALLVDTLAQEGVLVERWLPKAGLSTGALDLRMVVIGGKACHTVVRQSRSPLTNLHLGNQRGSLEVVQDRLGEAGWARLQRLAEAAAAALPPHSYVGLDVLIQRDWQQFAVLEANAFGDLLPHVTHQGKNTYETVVTYWDQVGRRAGEAACTHKLINTVVQTNSVNPPIASDL